MKLKNVLNEQTTQQDWDRAIKDIAMMIVEMAHEDAQGQEDPKEEFENNLEQYTEDAVKDIKEMIKRKM